MNNEDAIKELWEAHAALTAELAELTAERDRLFAAINWHRISTLYQKRGTTQHDQTLWKKCLPPLAQRDPWPNAH